MSHNRNLLALKTGLSLAAVGLVLSGCSNAEVQANQEDLSTAWSVDDGKKLDITPGKLEVIKVQYAVGPKLPQRTAILCSFYDDDGLRVKRCAKPSTFPAYALPPQEEITGSLVQTVCKRGDDGSVSFIEYPRNDEGWLLLGYAADYVDSIKDKLVKDPQASIDGEPCVTAYDAVAYRAELSRPWFAKGKVTVFS